jgi:sugar diacid utilization regulator
MATAYLASTATAATVPAERPSSSLLNLAKRVMSAVIEARMKSAEAQLRRHEALVSDLCRRQSHAPEFLAQADQLPFKI